MGDKKMMFLSSIRQTTTKWTWLLIRVLGFNLLGLFFRLHGRLWRLGHVTAQELARQLDRAPELGGPT